MEWLDALNEAYKYAVPLSLFFSNHFFTPALPFPCNQNDGSVYFLDQMVDIVCSLTDLSTNFSFGLPSVQLCPH
jgi:hypothetical protein